MSSGDSLEHECQTSIEYIFARTQFRFSCMLSHNVVHNALLPEDKGFFCVFFNDYKQDEALIRLMAA